MYKTWPDQEGLVNACPSVGFRRREERMPSPTCSHYPPLLMQISKRMLKRIAECGPCFIHFVVGRGYCTNLNIFTKFLSTLANSSCKRFPSLPITKSLSIVASLLNLISDILLSPFDCEGSIFTSKSSCHFS